MKVTTFVLLSLLFSMSAFSQEVKTLELNNVENVKVEKEIKKEESDEKTLEFKKGSNFTFTYLTSSDTKPTKDMREFLDKLSEWMKNNPNGTIRVVGHSDQVGTGKEITDRSMKRAEKVKNYIIHKSGVNSARFLISGQGARVPVADIYSEMGKAQNRRVEIDIVAE